MSAFCSNPWHTESKSDERRPQCPSCAHRDDGRITLANIPLARAAGRDYQRGLEVLRNIHVVAISAEGIELGDGRTIPMDEAYEFFLVDEPC